VSNDPNDGFYVPPSRSKRARIERLRDRLAEFLPGSADTRKLRDVLKGVLDLLADEL